MNAGQFRSWLESLDICGEMLDWVDSLPTEGRVPEQVWALCKNGDYLVWFLNEIGGFSSEISALGLQVSERALKVHALAPLKAGGLFEAAAEVEALPPIVDKATAESVSTTSFRIRQRALNRESRAALAALYAAVDALDSASLDTTIWVASAINAAGAAARFHDWEQEVAAKVAESEYIANLVRECVSWDRVAAQIKNSTLENSPNFVGRFIALAPVYRLDADCRWFEHRWEVLGSSNSETGAVRLLGGRVGWVKDTAALYVDQSWLSLSSQSERHWKSAAPEGAVKALEAELERRRCELTVYQGSYQGS